MNILLENSLSRNELLTLASIVQVGDATYKELIEKERPMFGHPYCSDIKGRMRTKLVQMECEIESHDPKFPFEFCERHFSHNQRIPELRTKNMILHIGRSRGPSSLPYSSKYKRDLSQNNQPLCRQMVLDFNHTPPFGLEPFYGILVFGGNENTFSIIQFPEPGYKKIAATIEIPQISLTSLSKEEETFKRKKANLRKEFLEHGAEEVNLH